MGAVIADETFAVGFTGTRAQTTDFQQKRLLELLVFLRAKGAYTFHHGDCIGADALAHELAVRAGFQHIVIHPPTVPMYRAYTDQLTCPPKGITVETKKPYLTRNQDIVNASTVMVAMPKGDEITRSGTWSTVRYARDLARYLYILYPYRVVREADPWDWQPSEPVNPTWQHPSDRKENV